MKESSQRSKGILRKSSRIVRLPGDNSQGVDMNKFWKKESKMSKAMEIIKNLGEEMDEEQILQELIKTFPDSEEEIQGSFNTEGRYGSWIPKRSGSFTADGTEYNWVMDQETLEELALALVKNDLENEPGLFNQEWLQGFIAILDTDKRIIASEEADNRVGDMSDDEVVEEAGMTVEYEEASDDEKENIVNNAREAVTSKISDEMEDALEDPVDYFVTQQGIYSVEDLMKQSWISIDIDAAAESAVSVDGAAHFTSLYNGETEETENGVVYFREN